MPVDIGLVTPRGRVLAAALREMRTRRGISGRELGKRLGLSHSAISHWETGRRIPSPEETASVLTALGVIGVEKHRLIELARNASDPNWFSVGITSVADRIGAVIECERAASTITSWEPGIVPGLLQTSQYAKAIMLDAGKPITEAESAVLVRAGRKAFLTEPGAAQFHAIIGEAAVGNCIGGQMVMADQLRHLIEMSKRENITLQLMPIDTGCWHPGTAGPFILYCFPDAPSLIYFEHFRSSAFNPDPDDVQVYHNSADRLAELALDAGHTQDFLLRAAEEMERSDDLDRVAEVEP
jgi:transcriptional regulator with XRE-family HTH domain